MNNKIIFFLGISLASLSYSQTIQQSNQNSQNNQVRYLDLTKPTQTSINNQNTNTGGNIQNQNSISPTSGVYISAPNMSANQNQQVNQILKKDNNQIDSPKVENKKDIVKIEEQPKEKQLIEKQTIEKVNLEQTKEKNQELVSIREWNLGTINEIEEKSKVEDAKKYQLFYLENANKSIKKSN